MCLRELSLTPLVVHVLFYCAVSSQVSDYSLSVCGVLLCCKCKQPTRAVRYSLLRTGEEEIKSDPQVDKMKQRLQFHFMNPFQKWSFAPKRRFPWKMLLQMVNMILVIVQVQTWCSVGSLVGQLNFILLHSICLLYITLLYQWQVLCIECLTP